jgi:hypothetical protein
MNSYQLQEQEQDENVKTIEDSLQLFSRTQKMFNEKELIRFLFHLYFSPLVNIFSCRACHQQSALWTYSINKYKTACQKCAYNVDKTEYWEYKAVASNSISRIACNRIQSTFPILNVFITPGFDISNMSKNHGISSVLISSPSMFITFIIYIKRADSKTVCIKILYIKSTHTIYASIINLEYNNNKLNQIVNYEIDVERFMVSVIDKIHKI